VYAAVARLLVSISRLATRKCVLEVGPPGSSSFYSDLAEGRPSPAGADKLDCKPRIFTAGVVCCLLPIWHRADVHEFRSSLECVFAQSRPHPIPGSVGTDGRQGEDGTPPEQGTCSGSTLPSCDIRRAFVDFLVLRTAAASSINHRIRATRYGNLLHDDLTVETSKQTSKCCMKRDKSHVLEFVLHGSGRKVVMLHALL